MAEGEEAAASSAVCNLGSAVKLRFCGELLLGNSYSRHQLRYSLGFSSEIR